MNNIAGADAPDSTRRTGPVGVESYWLASVRGPEPLDAEQLAKLAQEIELSYNRVHDQIPGDAATKAHHTTRIIAARYGLLYYAGVGDRLRRIA